MGDLAALDLTPVHDALASKAHAKIADICDQLMLKIASEGVQFQDEWPYAVHLLGHIYVNDISSARFLWKSIPLVVKDGQPEVVAAWTIAKRLWTRDYIGVHEAIKSYSWSAQTKDLVTAYSGLYVERMFQLILSAYSIISIQDTALFLGMTVDDATKCVLQRGWSIEQSSGMITVNKPPVVSEQKLDATKLQCLTEYVFNLEH